MSPDIAKQKGYIVPSDNARTCIRNFKSEQIRQAYGVNPG
jgi:hypothetical protein